MPPVATQAARSAAAPATRPRPRRAPAWRPAAPRTQTSRARRPRTARPYAGTPMPARLVPITIGGTATAESGLAEAGLDYRPTPSRPWIGVATAPLAGIGPLTRLARRL